MSRILAFLNEQPRTRIVLLGLLSVAFLGTLDYLTGYEISFSIFYLLPVAVAAWYADRGASAPVLLVQAPSNGRQQPETSRD